MSANAVRACAQSLHEEVRVALHDVARRIPDARGGDASRLAELRVSLQRLAATIGRHNTIEQRVLDPLLETVDAWGPVRVERLHHLRDEETRLVQAGIAGPDARTLIATACQLIRPLARLLRQEEREALPAELLRDDVISIDQEDG